MKKKEDVLMPILMRSEEILSDFKREFVVTMIVERKVSSYGGKNKGKAETRIGPSVIRLPGLEQMKEPY